MGFTRAVCGIDRGPESLEAARQAALLVPAAAPLLLVSAVDAPLIAPPEILDTEWDISATYDPELFEALEEGARANLEEARAKLAALRPVETLLIHGNPVDALLDAVAGEPEALLAVGVHEEHRLLGLLGGSVATAVLHGAPCSVLLARAPAEPGAFPGAIVVGVDGSEPSLEAVALAVALAGRLGAVVRALVAEPQKHPDGAEVRRRFPALEVAEIDRDPVDALCESGAGLLVVGHRGLSGLRSLGSVSERVAHKAPCPVLVVR